MGYVICYQRRAEAVELTKSVGQDDVSAESERGIAPSSSHTPRTSCRSCCSNQVFACTDSPRNVHSVSISNLLDKPTGTCDHESMQEVVTQRMQKR